MTNQQKHQFIQEDLYHELRSLLGAATLWRTFKKNQAGFDVVVAEDSAFVHARCLFYFFTRETRFDVNIIEFGMATPYSSALFDTWEEPLNRHVLHINKRRITPSNIQGTSHLKNRVEDFAREILSIWERAEQDLSPAFALAFNKIRRQAIQDAANDASGRIKPIFIL